MLGANGGLIGGTRTASALGSGIGLWTPNEQAALRRNRSWPLSGDPFYSYNSLLLSMDGSNNSTTFTDSSIYGLTVTANGDAKISTAQSKFGGASAVFDGTGDFLTAPVNTLFEFSTGDFTVETWVYFSSTSGECPIVQLGRGALGGGSPINTAWSVRYNGGNLYFYRYADPTEVSYAFAWTPSQNIWYHIGIARVGTSLRAFVNGTQIGTTQTSSTNYNRVNSEDLYIGRIITGSGTFTFNGYIDDLRITKGIARYTSNFTPPTQAHLTYGGYNDPYFVSTSLLLHMDGSNSSTTFTDSSLNALAVTANGNAQISTAESKFGGASGAFDGTGDYLTLADSSLWDFPADFTIEAWVKAAATGFGAIVSTRGTGVATLNPVLYLWNTGVVVWYYDSAARITGTTDIVGGGFYHVALCRSGSSTRLFVNGVQEGSTYSDSNSYVADGIWIGSLPVSSQHFNGYIDDLRITKGVARYTANFTPPNAAFPDA